jgi:hypothetical protein
MESTYTLARDAQAISKTLSALIEWLSAYVEQRPAELLTRQLASARKEASHPPSPPNVTGVASVVTYHAAMLGWLGDVRKALRRVPAGATALALTHASDHETEAGPHNEKVRRVAWQAMSIAELVMYVNNVDEAARLLAFYCAFLESL